MPKRVADKALVRKHAREIQHRLRVVSVLERTMNAAHKQWWRKMKQQEVLIHNLERVEKQLKAELTQMKKRKMTYLHYNITPQHATAHSTSTRFVGGSDGALPPIDVTGDVRPQQQRPPSSTRFEKFVALSFEPTRLVTPDLTLESWRALAAQEWSMKSEFERSLYGDGAVR